MNKSFKVLWNKARGLLVVTDEHHHAMGKGKVRSTVMGSSRKRVVLWGSSLSLLGLLASPIGATTITPFGEAGTRPTVSTEGHVHTITPGVVGNNIALNRFSEFQLSAGDIANMKFGKDAVWHDTLVNLVKNGNIEVNGVLNTIVQRTLWGQSRLCDANGSGRRNEWGH